MKFRFSEYYLIVILLLSFSCDVISQNKILGKPENYKSPKDYFVVDDDNASVVQELYHNTRSKLKDEPWIVYSDRNNNPVFDSSKGINKKAEIQFGAEPYYVGDENEDWILLATGTYIGNLKVKDYKEIGWVEKSKVLLWNSTLIDKSTLIHKKVYLLNRADNLEAVINKKKNLKELIVNFYEDPKAQKVRSEKTIYDRYFVLKKENDMYLLCEDNILSDLYYKKHLLGWVDKRELEEWNTRVCLEPNFLKEAYDERKNNLELRCKAFASPFDVEQFLKKKSVKALWDNDPVLFAASEMSRTNPMRAPGNTLRFPMFKTQQIDGQKMYKSGTVGRVMLINDSEGKLTVVADKSIPENDFGQIKREASDHRNRMENVNIFFAIEGTEYTYAAKDQIKKTLASLEKNKDLEKVKNRKIGVLIYRDASEKDKIISFLPLTTDFNEVLTFIESTPFENLYDTDAYTSMYYGIEQSIKVAGFDKNSVNMLIVVGSNCDYVQDRDRKKLVETKGDKTYIEDKSPLHQSIADLELHVSGIQISDNGLRSGRYFGAQLQKLILNAAKYSYNKKTAKSFYDNLVSKNPDLFSDQPYMEFEYGATKSLLENSKPNRLRLSIAEKSLTLEESTASLNEIVSKALNYESILNQALADTYDGNELDVKKYTSDGLISAGAFASGMTDFYNKLNDQLKMDTEFVIESTGEKLVVYTEIYTPEKIQGAQHNLYTYVLFMPESDLYSYIYILEQNLTKSNFGTPDEKREALFTIYMNLLQQYGQDVLKSRDPESVTGKELKAIMQGIYAEGIEIDFPEDIEIGNIRKTKEVSDETVKKLIDRLVKVKDDLDEIYKDKDRYDFCFQSNNGNRYFWIPMKMAF